MMDMDLTFFDVEWVFVLYFVLFTWVSIQIDYFCVVM